MKLISQTQNGWYVIVTNHEEYECHDLSLDDIKSILDQEWRREFNAITIGRDVDCKGQLGVFYFHDMAHVHYKEFDSRRWWSSYDFKALEADDWNRMTCLAPDDAQDFSFQKCSVITKIRAWGIVESYIELGEITELFLEGDFGRPTISSASVP